MLKNISQEDKTRMESVGMNLTPAKTAGSLFIENKQPLFRLMNDKGVEVLDMKTALEKYDGLKEYYWKLINPDQDKYTRQAYKNFHQGYFIRALPGKKVTIPVQACLFIGKEKFEQNVHNIIIAEEGSEVNIITGCLTANYVNHAQHIGISEMFVKKNAKMSFTMIHHWGENVKVRPITAIRVEKKSTFLSNYICVKPVKDLQMAPSCFLEGEESAARFNSLLYSFPGSNMDIGTKVFLKGKKSRAEIVSKTINNGGEITVRGYMAGMAPDIKSHLDCQGLIIHEKGRIRAIPELDAMIPDLDMTHEASIGRVSQEAIEYLQSRGLSEKEALSLITKGFLDISAMDLPIGLDKQLVKYLEKI
jgi:uncharacterized protein